MTQTYRELDQESGQFAAGLVAAGLGPGDVVAIQLPNVPQFLTVYFGALKAGMTVLPMNPLLKAPEIEHQLSDSGAAIMVGLAGLHAEAAKACELVGLPLYLVGEPRAGEGTRPATELMSTAPLSEPGGEIWPGNAEDTAVLIYTSGTTGKPKGAELTHFLLYMNCTVSGQLFGARPDDVTLAVLPFFHVFGLSSVLNVSVRYGGCLSIVPRFEPGAVLDAIEADKCTVIAGVPTMLHALAQLDVTGRDLAALRVAVSGGASLSGERHGDVRDQVRHRGMEGYGLSGTGSTSSFNRRGDRKPLWVGKPIGACRCESAILTTIRCRQARTRSGRS